MQFSNNIPHHFVKNRSIKPNRIKTAIGHSFQWPVSKPTDQYPFVFLLVDRESESEGTIEKMDRTPELITDRKSKSSNPAHFCKGKALANK